MNAEQNERVKGFGRGMEDVAPEKPAPVTISTIGIRCTAHLVNRAVKALRDAGRVPDADALKSACAATEDVAEKERLVWAVVSPKEGPSCS